jgi:hypothetical protein
MTTLWHRSAAPAIAAVGGVSGWRQLEHPPAQHPGRAGGSALSAG